MTIEDTREKILTDDAFVLAEVDKIRYLYKLKQEIRYALKRTEVIQTESVAEHIYGMHIIANYFLPLENPGSTWDKQKILEIITWHDIDEVETGDTVTFLKTKIHQQEAKSGLSQVIANLPAHIKSHIESLMTEYGEQVTDESKFVKAIDKSEPFFEVYQEHYREIFHNNEQTLEKHWLRRAEYIKNYPCILRFAKVITNNLQERGFYIEAA